jgi:16S rRNA (cytosine1402-N4)-methyltransferase
MNFAHESVLLDEAVDMLQIKPDGLYVDATAGGGGHAQAILEKLSPMGRLIAIDRDSDAIAACKARLAPWEGQATIVRNSFGDISNILRSLSITSVDGILADLGVSSFQLDCAGRGFSYHTQAPLDMRMDRCQELTAYQVVNEFSHGEIARILSEYGEERFAGRIASAILLHRETGPIETTTQLAEIVKNAIPAATRRQGGHPARRSFQAIRIAVNSELDQIKRFLADGIEALRPGGRIAVITFHSLEDRIVKQTFAELAQGCTCPKSFPVCVCAGEPKVTVVNRKPVEPGESELERNPRSRSAKLRAAQRCG